MGARRRSVASVDARRKRCLELSIRGLRPDQIFERMEGEYKEINDVVVDLKRGLEDSRLRRESLAAQHDEREMMKLDMLEAAAAEVLFAHHYVVNQGMVVWHDPAQEPDGMRQGWAPAKSMSIRELKEQMEAERSEGSRPLRDYMPVLKACDTLLKIYERRSKYLGSDAPVKKQIEVSGSGGLDDKIQTIMEDLASGGQREPTSASTAGEGA